MTSETVASTSLPTIRRRRMMTLAALLAALLLGATLSWCIGRLPMTLYDALGEILDAERSPSVEATFVEGLTQRGYFRPLRTAQIKLVYDLAHGHLFFAFKAVEVALTLAACALFAILLAPATSIELVAAIVALMVLVGHHSSFVLLSEAYPINHFLEMLVLALFIAVLAKRKRGDRPAGGGTHAAPTDGAWWADSLALAALVAGLLTLESGVLLWVVLVACRVLGWRGISRRAVIAATVLLAAYFVWRVGVLHVGGPGLDERASGFGFHVVERFELAARFAADPKVFYAYNVTAAVLTTLFSEPRHGVFLLTRQWLDGDVPPWMIAHVVSSMAVTLLIMAFAVGAVRRVWLGRAGDRDRLWLLGLGMVAANAAVSYGYLKDEILSIGAAFYAAAAYAALAECGDRLATSRRTWLAGVVIPAFVVVSTLWTMRAAGAFYGLRAEAAKLSHEWAVHEFEKERPAEAADPRTRGVYDRLRRANLDVRVPIAFFTDEAEVQGVIEIR